MVLIYCACGCGQQRENLISGRKDRPATYINGHERRGKHHTEESKEKNRFAHLGKYDSEKNPFYGKHHTEETLNKISGKNSPLYIDGCGKKRAQSKRNRVLGFNPVNESLNDDEVAHHLTEEFVAFVPEFINKSISHNIHTGKNMDEVNFYTLNYLILIYNKEE